MHWTAGFRPGYKLAATGPPLVMCDVSPGVAMILTNSYFRSLVFSLGMFITVFLRLSPEYRAAGDPRRTVLLLSILCVASIVSTLLVGTFAGRGEKPWPWIGIGFASLGCWLALGYAMLLLQKSFAGR